MEDKQFLEQIIKNKNEIKKSIIVSDIIEAIEQFLIVSKEIKTIVNFEEKVRNFMGKGFPHKKDIDTLFLITSSIDNMKFFINNLNNFQSIMQGYLNEEIRNVYKNFSEEDIHIKYSSLFYQFILLIVYFKFRSKLKYKFLTDTFIIAIFIFSIDIIISPHRYEFLIINHHLVKEQFYSQDLQFVMNTYENNKSQELTKINLKDGILEELKYIKDVKK